MINTINHLVNSQINARKNSHVNFYQNCFDYAKNLYSKNLRVHYDSVNTIEFSNRECEHFASAGFDLKILIWSINGDVLSEKAEPKCLKNRHQAPVLTLAWDNENKRIFSGGYDKQVIIHDIETEQASERFTYDYVVFSISVHPEHSELFAFASEELCLYDLRISSRRPMVIFDNSRGSPFHSCCFNPIQPTYIATANLDSGFQLIDSRMQNKILLNYKRNIRRQEENTKDLATSVQFNKMGNQLLGLRLKQGPVLYNLLDPEVVLQLGGEDYNNYCTFKSCCFVGDRDQYACSGSDDSSIYIWKILPNSTHKSDKVHLQLKGHRSFVRQVRYNSKFHILLASGVEKIIKAWTPYRIENSMDSEMDNEDVFPPRRSFERWRSTYNYNNVGQVTQHVSEVLRRLSFLNRLHAVDNNWVYNEDHYIIDSDSNSNDQYEAESSNSDAAEFIDYEHNFNNNDDVESSSTSDSDHNPSSSSQQLSEMNQVSMSFGELMFSFDEELNPEQRANHYPERSLNENELNTSHECQSTNEQSTILNENVSLENDNLNETMKCDSNEEKRDDGLND